MGGGGAAASASEPNGGAGGPGRRGRRRVAATPPAEAGTVPPTPARFSIKSRIYANRRFSFGGGLGCSDGSCAFFSWVSS
jgi:hypothetical protein